MQLMTAKPYTVKDFWRWFLSNLDRLQNLNNDTLIFDELMTQVHKIDDRLEFLYTYDTKHILYVSCGGIYDVIPKVEELVIASPSIENWQIVAFKQRLPEAEFQNSDDVVIYQGKYEVDPFSAKMILRPNGNKYDLFIYSPKNRMEQGHISAYFLLLDMLIGEYEVMTKLAGIKVTPLNQDVDSALIQIRDIL